MVGWVHPDLPVGVNGQFVCEQLSDSQDGPRNGFSPAFVRGTWSGLILVIHEKSLFVPDTVCFQLFFKFPTQRLGRFPFTLGFALSNQLNVQVSM